MPVMRTSRFAISFLLCAGLLLALLTSEGPVRADPVRADTSEELAAARERVAELHAEANAAYQEIYKAEADLAAVTTELERLRGELALAAEDARQSRREVGRVARASYISGGLESSLFLLLSSDPSEFNAQHDSLQRVAAATTRTLDLHRDREARLAGMAADVAERQRQAAELRGQMAAALDTVQAKVAEAERIEAHLEEKFATELAAARDQQRRESAAAALAAQQGRQSEGGPTSAVPGVPTASGGTALDAVLDFALAQVGKGYVLGASGPDRYDCSGLVLAAYARAGISLPHYTHYQAARTRPVSLSQARPGDLLFYFELGASHVAIYLGDGRMVHATNPRRGVVVSSINESWYAQRLTSVGRVVD